MQIYINVLRQSNESHENLYEQEHYRRRNQGTEIELSYEGNHEESTEESTTTRTRVYRLKCDKGDINYRYSEKPQNNEAQGGTRG